MLHLKIGHVINGSCFAKGLFEVQCLSQRSAACSPQKNHITAHLLVQPTGLTMKLPDSPLKEGRASIFCHSSPNSEPISKNTGFADRNGRWNVPGDTSAIRLEE